MLVVRPPVPVAEVHAARLEECKERHMGKEGSRIQVEFMAMLMPRGNEGALRSRVVGSLLVNLMWNFGVRASGCKGANACA